MKISLLIIIITTFNLNLFAQDGSDILYFDEVGIDSGVVGKYIHVDFYENSFGSNKFENVKADTVIIKFNNEELEFTEVRNDDRYNNWFSEQYLETIKSFNKKKIRIEKMKVLAISKDSIKVKLFGHFFYEDGKVENTEYLIEVVSFDRKNIFQILLNSKPPIKKGLSLYQVYGNPLIESQKKKRECNYCFTPSENNLYDYPLISEYQIEMFDFGNQRIVLTKAGKRIIEKLEIPLEGMPLVFTLNGEILYVLWLWNLKSSFGCDRVYTYPKLDFALKFGLPEDFKFGEDPRYNEKLKEYLDKKK